MTKNITLEEWELIFDAASRPKAKVSKDLIGRARNEMVRMEHLEMLTGDPNSADGTPALTQSEWFDQWFSYFTDMHCSQFGMSQGISRPDDRSRVAEQYATMVTTVARHKPGTRDYN